MTKKILSLVVLFGIFIPNLTDAFNKDEMKIYKAIIVSRSKIEKDFPNWKSYNNSIKIFFERLRTNKDINKVNELDSKLEKYFSKNKNTSDKNYNLALNIYYRNKLLKDYIFKSKNQNNSIISNNSISEIISKWDQIKNKWNNLNWNISFTYSIPKWWNEEKNSKWETILKNTDWSTVFIVSVKQKDSFSKYKDNFKEELLKNNAIRNFSNYTTFLNNKETHIFNYNLDSYEKNIYLVNHKNMVLVINSSKKENVRNDLDEVINSINIIN